MSRSQDHIFWSGIGLLGDNEKSYALKCVASQLIDGKGNLSFTAEDADDQRIPFELGLELTLAIPTIGESIKVFATSGTWGSSKASVLKLQPSRTPCWSITGGMISRANLILLNFANFWFGSPRNTGFTLRVDGWKLAFATLGDNTLSCPYYKNTDDIRATQLVELTRDDGYSFSAEMVKELLANLTLFLAFCRGQWVGITLVAGVDNSGVLAFEQWGTGRVSNWTEPSGWLDEHHGESIVELAPLFFAKLKEDGWKDAIMNAIYWFGRGNTNFSGPDGACILLQAALERLAWQILLRGRKTISEKGFYKLDTADKLRLVFQPYGIPTSIPQHLKALSSLGKRKGHDGPEVFTYIRNQITHPLKSSEIKEVLPFFEAYSLAQWYIELIILAECGYAGKYGDRTKFQRWRGEVENVPWV